MQSQLIITKMLNNFRYYNSYDCQRKFIIEKKSLIIFFCLNSSDPSAPEIQSVTSDFDLPTATLTGSWIVSNYLGLLNNYYYQN